MEQDKKQFRKGLLVGGVLSFVVLSIFVIFTGAFLLLNKNILAKKQVVTQETSSEPFFSAETESKVKDILALIKEYCYWDYEEPQLVEGMYAGILNGLNDPYSVYYTEEEYKTIMESTTGKYSGIGALLGQKKETMEVQIIKVFKGSPAEEAGLQNGDVIVSVDDTEATGMELSNLVTIIKGEEGTKVHLQIKRESSEENAPIEVDIERRPVEAPSVDYEMLENDIGYIQLTEFTEVTVQQFEDAKNDLLSKGMKSLMIDLRNNPGGSFPAVCDIVDLIIPEGMIVYVETKAGERTEKHATNKDSLDIPIVVLVNEHSASASEIFAGAMKDHKYAKLIGTKTFGKGIVQSIVPMEDGSAVKVTTAKYFTPAGNDIHEKGIEPDIEIEFKYENEEDEVYDKMHDNQILRAIEELKKGK